MSTPLQRIQLGLLLGSLNPGGLVGALMLLLFVPFAIAGLLYYVTTTVKQSFQASASAIVSEIEAKGAGDRWRELAPLDLGQWFGDRPALAAHIVRECQARNVQPRAEKKRWDGSPEERVCYSAAHPIPRPVLSKEPSAW
jgi:hypothetical protein